MNKFKTLWLMAALSIIVLHFIVSCGRVYGF